MQGVSTVSTAVYHPQTRKSGIRFRHARLIYIDMCWPGTIEVVELFFAVRLQVEESHSSSRKMEYSYS